MKEVTKLKKGEDISGGLMIRLTADEALETIKSLISQLIAENPNTDRVEMYYDNGKYFSISVTDYPKSKVRKSIEKKNKEIKDLQDTISTMYPDWVESKVTK